MKSFIFANFAAEIEILAASVEQKQHLIYTYDNEARPAKPLEQGKVSVKERTLSKKKNGTNKKHSRNDRR